MIKPTVGRVVWYYPNGADVAVHELPRHEDGPVPMAAQIVYVWNDRNVNLLVTDHTGVQWARSSVMLLQGDEDFKPRGAYVAWMPYQVGQARQPAPVIAPAIAGLINPNWAEQAREYANRVENSITSKP